MLENKASERCGFLGFDSFPMLGVKAAIGIRLDGTVMHYKL